MQKIYCIKFKTIQSILCMSCCENQATFGRQRMSDVQPAGAIHFNIQKNQVRFAPANLLQSDKRFAESCQFQSAFSFAELSDNEQCDGFVVNSDTTNLFHHN